MYYNNLSANLSPLRSLIFWSETGGHSLLVCMLRYMNIHLTQTVERWYLLYMYLCQCYVYTKRIQWFIIMHIKIAEFLKGSF